MGNTNMKFISQKMRPKSRIFGPEWASCHFGTRLYMGITWTFFSFSLRFGFWAPFFQQGLTWAMLGAWNQNHPQVVGTGYVSRPSTPTHISNSMFHKHYLPYPTPQPLKSQMFRIFYSILRHEAKIISNL